LSDNKKYYYLKLKENFFDTDEIKVLEGMSNGYKYSNILLKLYLKSLKNNGALRLNEFIPYNVEMIASVTRHDVDTVRTAMQVFEQMKLLETLENGTIYMLDIQNFIGNSSTEADRIRSFRKQIEEEKSKTLLPVSTNVVQMYDKSTPEIEIELEKEIDIEKENNISDSNEYRLAAYLFKHIRKNNESSKEPNWSTWAKQFDYILRVDKRDLEEVKQIIRFCQTDEFWHKNILSPDKLRKQYDRLYLEMKKPVKNKGKTDNFNNFEQREYDYDSLEKKLLGWE
jgi:predicted phage replisome organizer